MKKLTKSQKQKIKNKLLKITNIVSYILSGLFIIILVISMCQSCDSKSVSNNDHDSQQRRNNDIQYVINNEYDYMLPREANNNNTYGQTFNGQEEIITFLNDVVSDTSNSPFTNSVNFYFNFYEDGEYYQNDFYQVLKVDKDLTAPTNKLRYLFYRDGVDNYFTLEFDTLILFEGRLFLSLYTYNDNVIIKPFIINYLHFYTRGDISNDLEFTIPPYFYIGDYNSFSYDIGFIFNDNFYNKIVYDYRKSFKFLNTLNNTSFNYFSLEVTEDTGKVYFTLSNEYYYIKNKLNLTELPKLTFTSFGTKGKIFLDTYFISNDDLFTGTYQLSLKKVEYYLFRLNNPWNDTTITFMDTSLSLKGIFKSNEKYFNGLNFEVDYSNNVYTGAKLYLFNENTTIKILDVYYRDGELLVNDFNQDYSVIYYELDTIDLETWNVLKCLYTLNGIQFIGYYTENTEDNVYLGNVFALFNGAFSGLISLFAISIIPGISLGVLVFIPLIIIIILFVVDLFKR